MVGNKPAIAIKKTLFIISAIPVLDQQGASFARILAYSKAVVLDKDVSVYMLSTKYPTQLNRVTHEISKNVFICGAANTETDHSTFAKRTTGKVFGKAAFHEFLKNTNDFIDGVDGQKAVLVYPSINNHADELKLIKLIKSKNIPVFSERNELNIGKMLNYPFPKNPVKKVIFGIYFPFKYTDHYKQDKLVAQYNGNIAISTTMEKRIARLNKNQLRIPILADVESFSKVVSNKAKSNEINIGFTGYLTIKKDGIGELIKAIALLKNKYEISTVKLNLFGTGYRDTLAKLKAQITNLGLKDQVILHGKVPSEDIPVILKQQDILVLTRPVNLQTRYGFSTKLAEYMASGVAVLTTDVSDNALYIQDGVNGFIAKSYKADDTAEKLNEIISQKKYQDKNIGLKARETALEHFDGKKYSADLLKFFFPN